MMLFDIVLAEMSTLLMATTRSQHKRRQANIWCRDRCRWEAVEGLFGKRGLQSFVYEVAILELQVRVQFIRNYSDF